MKIKRIPITRRRDIQRRFLLRNGWKAIFYIDGWVWNQCSEWFDRLNREEAFKQELKRHSKKERQKVLTSLTILRKDK